MKYGLTIGQTPHPDTCTCSEITNDFLVDEGELKKRFRQSLQTVFPVCGDLLLGETQIRRQLLSEVNVPTGAQVMISNNRHARTPSPIAEMRQRRDALLHKALNYNLFTLNCEHFATFIRYGQAVCNQVRAQICSILEYYEQSNPCGL